MQRYPVSAFRVAALALSLACSNAEPSPAPRVPSAESAPQTEVLQPELPQSEVPQPEAAARAEAQIIASSEEGSARPPPAAAAIPAFGNLVTTQALLVSLLLAPFSTQIDTLDSNRRAPR